MRRIAVLTTALLVCLGLAACQPSGGKWDYTDAKKGLTSDLYPCPLETPIKGNKNGKKRLYHSEKSPWYLQTSPRECFSTVSEAEDAGYSHW